jgi:hypothetical protein
VSTTHVSAMAAARSPGQCKNWYWVCFGGAIFFLLRIPLLRGRWSSSAANRDLDAHEQRVQQEIDQLARTEPTDSTTP